VARPTDWAAAPARPITASADEPNTDSTAPAFCCNSEACLAAAAPIPIRPVVTTFAALLAFARPRSHDEDFFDAWSKPFAAAVASEMILIARIAVRAMIGSSPFGVTFQQC
jgi:hypothetical protein